MFEKSYYSSVLYRVEVKTLVTAACTPRIIPDGIYGSLVTIVRISRTDSPQLSNHRPI